jgi:hypothetical protein
MQTKAEISARHPPPRSGLVQLLSELPALPAGYPGTHKPRRAKSAATSFNKPRIVNFLS